MSIIETYRQTWLPMVRGTHVRRATLELVERARSLEIQNDELIEMLRKYEWWEGTCLECDQWEPNHLPGCDLARLIKGGRL